MISFDIECSNGHRFEGTFKDYDSFARQMERTLIACPLCECTDVKRLFTGCAIQARPSATPSSRDPETVTLFDAMRIARAFVREHFENTGAEFAERARAIHYGVEEPRGIYGETTPDEVRELREEGIAALFLPDPDRFEN
ncbi:MAG TPA: DUF1178 family protein [Spirochaetota bacterium]|nr:DUF1178 family protein [Spirochaetota bacterium]HNT10195.1 DUF1178 family protein [Spirochaetota bacterium]HOS39209.1 DUF1178 family protein [Spirochaetota bacterium]HPU87955.1 DUF1178 family protein [Spirochaetota bacterium]